MKNQLLVGLQELCNYTPEKLQEDAEKWGHNYLILLKEQGYSVGLTSKFPIEVKEKIFDGMHHGALHCKTAGIDILWFIFPLLAIGSDGKMRGFQSFQRR